MKTRKRKEREEEKSYGRDSRADLPLGKWNQGNQRIKNGLIILEINRHGKVFISVKEVFLNSGCKKIKMFI